MKRAAIILAAFCLLLGGLVLTAWVFPEPVQSNCDATRLPCFDLGPAK